MSRIGKKPVPLPKGVTANVDGRTVRVKGPKGELSLRLVDEVDASVGEDGITIAPREGAERGRQMWGLSRTLVNNLVVGVTQGFSQRMEINGVGYRAAVQGKNLNLQLGFSHDISYPIPAGINIVAEKPTALMISGIDKQLVGQVAAEIRGYRPPEPYKGAGKLKEKVALITGGDSGIGRAVAVLFAREGADVAFTFLKEEKTDADETKRAIEAEGQRAVALPGDVRDPKICKKLVEQTVDELGKLDILVNNAAFQQHQESIEDVTEEQWDRTFKTNIYAYFYMTKAALPHLEEGSAIVNTGSITGLEGSKELLDYASTKGAIHAFTKSLAQNLVERGIRVNCVAPGPVWTPLNPADKKARDVPKFGADTPM